jgi:hypothetical protein
MVGELAATLRAKSASISPTKRLVGGTSWSEASRIRTTPGSQLATTNGIMELKEKSNKCYVTVNSSLRASPFAQDFTDAPHF